MAKDTTSFRRRWFFSLAPNAPTIEICIMNQGKTLQEAWGPICDEFKTIRAALNIRDDLLTATAPYEKYVDGKWQEAF